MVGGINPNNYVIGMFKNERSSVPRCPKLTVPQMLYSEKGINECESPPPPETDPSWPLQLRSWSAGGRVFWTLSGCGLDIGFTEYSALGFFPVFRENYQNFMQNAHASVAGEYDTKLSSFH